MRYKIIEISSWVEDLHMEDGDACHMSEGDLMRRKLHEYEEKIENGKWPGLPFVCNAKNEEEAIEKYNAAHCKHDYYLADDVVMEDWHMYNPPRLRDILGVTSDDVLMIVDLIVDHCLSPVIRFFNGDFTGGDVEVLEKVIPYLNREVVSVDIGRTEDTKSDDGDEVEVETMWITLKRE